MLENDEAIRSYKDLAEDYKSGIERQDNLIKTMRRELDEKDAEIVRLQTMLDGLILDVPSLHKRRCRTCGNIAWHADNVFPFVVCGKCQSRDTRKITP